MNAAWGPFLWWGWVLMALGIVAAVGIVVLLAMRSRAQAKDEAGTPEVTLTERRIQRFMETIAKVIAPWKKALAERDRIIELLKGQRGKYKERLGEYITALKERDGIIVQLRDERDHLKSQLEAIENSEKPADSSEVTEHELPASPGEAPKG